MCGVPWGVCLWALLWRPMSIVGARHRRTNQRTRRGRLPGHLLRMYVGEGLNGTVAVTLMRTTAERSFHSAGKVQASNDPRDMRLQRMLGHIRRWPTRSRKTCWWWRAARA